jgi:hypothetical protein
MDNLQEEHENVMRRETPVVLQKRQRTRGPFGFRVGSLTIAVTCVLLIALMSVLYLNQLGQAAKANQALQQIQNQRAALSRQQQDLNATIAQEQLPTYVAAHAAQQGLVPPDWRKVRIVKIQGLQSMGDQLSSPAANSKK